MLKNLLKVAPAVLTLAVFVGCGSSNKMNSTPSTSQSPGNNFSSVDLSGFAVGGSYDGVQVVTIDPQALTISFSLPLLSAPVGGAVASTPVDGVPGGTVSVGQNATGFWQLTFTMPLKNLIKGITYQNPAALPNGNPLPGIQAAQLPMLATTANIDGRSLYLWGNNTNFAMFWPTPHWNPGIDLLLPVQNKAKTKTLGYFGLVQKVNNFAGGLYIDVILGQDLQTAIGNLPTN